MAQRVCVVLNTAEREQLAAIVADRNRPHKHVKRARIAEPHSALGNQLGEQDSARAIAGPAQPVRNMGRRGECQRQFFHCGQCISHHRIECGLAFL